ncbi:MAG: cation:proton antiporter [Erysipelotrichaceae bacterium]
MLDFLYEQLSDSQAAVIIISLSIMLMAGFLMTRVTKKLKLPNVTAYIVVGILIGPYCLDLIPDHIVTNTAFLADIALAFIAFSTGEFFKISKLKKNFSSTMVITLCEAILASVLIFILCFYIFELNLPFSLILAALASATAPASTLMTIRQTKARGEFVDTLLLVVALDDIVALLSYSVVVSLSASVLNGNSFSIANMITPLLLNILMIVLGGLFGWLMSVLINKKRSTDNRLIIAIALLLGFCGICTALSVSPLLGCMMMACCYINISDDDKLFKQLNYFSPPILLLFFVRSGVSFDLSSLFNNSGEIGSVSIIVIASSYFLVRIVGKYVGSFLGCLLVGKQKEVRNYLGLALIPQAGVAIGLAATGARILAYPYNQALQTIILASSVLYELVGPASSKLALYLSKSYSNKLEDIVAVETVDENNPNSVEILIERIKKIQQDLALEQLDENEQAYTDAASEYLQQEK